MLPTDRNLKGHGGKKGAKKMRGGIWIQSQGGKILAFVDVVEFVVYGGRKTTKNVIVGNRILDLGVYQTEDRAVEVLNEIQESIIEKKKLYEMPKE